jgi:hypothetical protein
MTQAPDTRTRVLVFAPTGRDGDAAADQLGAAGLTAVVCKDMLQLVKALQEGAGAAVVAEEAFRTGLAALTDWVGKQPPWSDFPFVVLTSQRIYVREDARRIQVLESLERNGCACLSSMHLQPWSCWTGRCAISP